MPKETDKRIINDDLEKSFTHSKPKPSKGPPASLDPKPKSDPALKPEPKPTN